MDCDLSDPGQSHSSAQHQSRCNRSCDVEDAIGSPFLAVSGWNFLSLCFLASTWQEKPSSRGGGQGALWIGHYCIVASSLPEFWEAVCGWPEAPNRRLHFNLPLHYLALYLLQQGDENIVAPTLQNRHLRNKEPQRINEVPRSPSNPSRESDVPKYIKTYFLFNIWKETRHGWSIGTMIIPRSTGLSRVGDNLWNEMSLCIYFIGQKSIENKCR
ncbi:uncharacterized protein LOC120919146 [Rana temporaria]|uniref:uncharacterized protein LOC120919146 n=1 Tax=Rana temporaria TaxID=8407 RepID=UPI001AAE1499|nr:uncharacterized protein LOC120919146 [Rana temporaria]